MSIFKGREEAVVKWCVAQLAELKKISQEEVLQELSAAVVPTLTEEDIESRNYTYCSYIAPPLFLKFLVPSVRKETSRGMARAYLKSVGVDPMYSKNLHLFPRNYVIEARQLFKENTYLH